MGQMKPSPTRLGVNVGNLERCALVFQTITALLPPRSTNRQVTAFFTVAATVAAGKSITQGELVSLGADDPVTGPIFGTAPERILAPFMQKTKRDPDAVEWLAQEEDPDDRRRKLLRLTPKGRKVVDEVLGVMFEGA